MINSFKVSNLPETLRKFFKQIQKLYERDSDFQKYLDYLIENGQVAFLDFKLFRSNRYYIIIFSSLNQPKSLKLRENLR